MKEGEVVDSKPVLVFQSGSGEYPVRAVYNEDEHVVEYAPTIDAMGEPVWKECTSVYDSTIPRPIEQLLIELLDFVMHEKHDPTAQHDKKVVVELDSAPKVYKNDNCAQCVLSYISIEEDVFKCKVSYDKKCPESGRPDWCPLPVLIVGG